MLLTLERDKWLRYYQPRRSTESGTVFYYIPPKKWALQKTKTSTKTKNKRESHTYEISQDWLQEEKTSFLRWTWIPFDELRNNVHISCPKSLIYLISNRLLCKIIFNKFLLKRTFNQIKQSNKQKIRHIQPQPPLYY